MGLDKIYKMLADALEQLDDYNGDNRESYNYEAIEGIYREIRDQLDELYDLI
jgi:hypothetical protein